MGCKLNLFFFTSRVQVRDREIKVNIFDMAGHPFFYEVLLTLFYICMRKHIIE